MDSSNALIAIVIESGGALYVKNMLISARVRAMCTREACLMKEKNGLSQGRGDQPSREHWIYSRAIIDGLHLQTRSRMIGELTKITIVVLMKSASVDTMVPKIQAVLAGKPVTRAWIFGSYSRGEETPQSDVNILVQYDANCRLSLLDISRIMVELSKALGVQVDLVEDGRLLPFAVDSVNRDRILVYDRAS